MLFKLSAAVRSADDLCDETTAIIGTGAEIQARLSALYPAIAWRPASALGTVFGGLEGPDGRYEFMLGAAADRSFAVHAPRHAASNVLVPEICREFGLVAFDLQTGALVGG